jgi:hypothetical protein
VVALRLGAFSILAAGLALGQQLTLEPAKQFGTSITGALEGWFDNPDGSHSFLIGYLNRNRSEALDVPIGPNNQLMPGGPDLGQPTHFLPGRQWGVFIVTVPKDFDPEKRIVWTISVNGQPTTIPLHLHPDYNISPFVDAENNTPPIIRLDEHGQGIQGPIGTMAKAIARTTTVGKPLPLTAWVTDDMVYTSGTNAPLKEGRPPVTLEWTQYRGAGTVTFDKAKPQFKKMPSEKGFSGEASTNATFSEPGEYVLQVTANDYSGVGGGGFQCCWTTALVKVTVTQ